MSWLCCDVGRTWETQTVTCYTMSQTGPWQPLSTYNYRIDHYISSLGSAYCTCTHAHTHAHSYTQADYSALCLHRVNTVQ